MDNSWPNPHLDRTLIPLAVKPHQSACSLHLISNFCFNFWPQRCQSFFPQTTPSIRHKWRVIRGTARSFLTVDTSSKSKRWDSNYVFLLIFPPGYLPHICQQWRRRTGQAASFWGDSSFFQKADSNGMFSGAWSEHLCGGHATSLCNDCWRPPQELLLQKALLS